MNAERDEEAEAKSNLAAEADEEAQAEESYSEATAEVAAPVQAGRILGVNTRHYPMQSVCCLRPDKLHVHFEEVGQCGDPPPTVAVLVSGDIGDYACYVGHGSPNWVRDHGDKIRFEEACCHFPGGQLKRELYRQ